MNWLENVIGHLLADVVGAGQDLAGDIGHNRDSWLAQRQAGHDLGELGSGARHQRRVGSDADRQPDDTNGAPSTSELSRAIERRGLAREHDLSGRVGVRQGDDAAGGGLGDHGLDCLPLEPEHGEHSTGALIPVLFHQAAALADQHKRAVEVHDIRGDQGGELTEAVPGDVEGGDHLTHRLPALAHHIQAGDAHREDRGLGVEGVVQVLLGALEAEAAQPEAEDVVGPPENAAGGLGYLVQGFAHAHVLRALAGEDEGHGPATVGGDHCGFLIRRRIPSP